jgi:hypothetical protein
MAMFSFLHLSDPHLAANREDKVYGVNPYNKLEAAMRRARRRSFACISSPYYTPATADKKIHVHDED